MQKTLFLTLILFFVQEVFSQSFFEGDINYKFELQKKDSSFDETSIITYPANSSIGIYKNGNWLHKPDDGIIEYSYFNQVDNRLYWKIKNADTIFYELGNKQREAEVDTTLTAKIEYNTDTILGFPCNRLIIQTKNLKLIFIYSPSLSTNPLWFQDTKIGYYDIIAGLTKAIWLESIVETKDFISKMIAQNIHQRKIADTEFPDISKKALKKL